MKTIFFLLSFKMLILAGSYNCSGQTDDIILHDSMQKAEKLRTLYEKSFYINADSSYYYKQRFFEAFPSSFSEFVSLYGYHIDKGKYLLSVLYYDAKSHIDLLSELDTIIPQNFYFTKLIDISISGYWQADGVGYFKKLLIEKIDTKLCCFLWTLKKFTDDEIRSFWVFYFDNPNPLEEIPDNLQIIEYYDKNIFNLMSKALAEVKINWKDK